LFVFRKQKKQKKKKKKNLCFCLACNKCVQPFFSEDLLWTKPQDVCLNCKKSLEAKIKRMEEAAKQPSKVAQADPPRKAVAVVAEKEKKPDVVEKLVVVEKPEKPVVLESEPKKIVVEVADEVQKAEIPDASQNHASIVIEGAFKATQGFDGSTEEEKSSVDVNNDSGDGVHAGVAELLSGSLEAEWKDHAQSLKNQKGGEEEADGKKDLAAANRRLEEEKQAKEREEAVQREKHEAGQRLEEEMRKKAKEEEGRRVEEENRRKQKEEEQRKQELEAVRQEEEQHLRKQREEENRRKEVERQQMEREGARRKEQEQREREKAEDEKRKKDQEANRKEVEQEEDGDNDKTVGDQSAVPSGGGAKKRPGVARGRAASRTTIREQAKQAQQEREAEDKALEEALKQQVTASGLEPAEKEHLVVGGSVADKRRSLAGAIPMMGMMMGSPGLSLRKKSVSSTEDRPEVVVHAAPQFGLGMGDLSNSLGSLRKRPVAAAASTPQSSTVSEEPPAIVKASELRKKAYTNKDARNNEQEILQRALTQLEQTPSRVSMSDLAYEQALKPKASPRVNELDGLIDEARRAVIGPSVPVPTVEVVRSPRIQLEAVSPYHSDGEGDYSRASGAKAKNKALELVQQANLEQPSPGASRQSMHIVEVDDDDEFTTDSED
jgi:hypothetical protein